ncbi:DUF3598 family protein [Moorena sp. SIO3B2]|uniref:DUF3598 family protein n=1 Tax=Moorena sp. SIO3B2 TaxID=2607827 RepID=UPI0013CAAB50|nr:DUF3598 family protein [Moorena sp. SIO3B2]NEP34401.1 DUF3598 family protein [Moorena sp. SIO3B2]
MDLKEQNWKNFTVNHLRDWHGIWTRYSPEGEVKESFQSLRSFRSNPEQTEIYHTNRYIYADGRIEEKNWQYDKQSMRGFFFEQGAAVLSGKQLESGAVLPHELLLKHEDIRHSVALIYDSNGSLMRAVSIREDAAGFPSKYWSKEINLLPERNLSGNWQGTAVTMTPDLKVSEPIATQIHWPLAGNKMFFFPDGISLSCPTKVSIGTSFNIAANWLVTDSQLQQLRVNYDNYGAFSGLTLELFHL